MSDLQKEQEREQDAALRRLRDHDVAQLGEWAGAVHDLRNLTRRTPEAQADIAAARAETRPLEVAMQEVDRQIEDVGRELQNAAPPPRQPYAPLDPASLPPGAVLLTGPEAERYRALRLAVRAAQDAARTAKDAGAALRDELQRFCAGADDGGAKP